MNFMQNTRIKANFTCKDIVVIFKFIQNLFIWAFQLEFMPLKFYGQLKIHA